MERSILPFKTCLSLRMHLFPASFHLVPWVTGPFAYRFVFFPALTLFFFSWDSFLTDPYFPDSPAFSFFIFALQQTRRCTMFRPQTPVPRLSGGKFHCPPPTTSVSSSFLPCTFGPIIVSSCPKARHLTPRATFFGSFTIEVSFSALKYNFFSRCFFVPASIAYKVKGYSFSLTPSQS